MISSWVKTTPPPPPFFFLETQLQVQASITTTNFKLSGSHSILVFNASSLETEPIFNF